MNTSSTTPDPLVFVREAVEDLSAYLAMWNARRPLPEADAPARAAAAIGLERIDRALHLLVELRFQLVTEIADEDRRWLALDDETPEG